MADKDDTPPPQLPVPSSDKNIKKRKRNASKPDKRIVKAKKKEDPTTDEEFRVEQHVSEGEEDELSSGIKAALKDHSDLVIDVAYEIVAIGFIWLINRKKNYGFVKITNPEWCMVREADVVYCGKGQPIYKQPIRIFQDVLPCKFSELVKQKPEIDNYFT